MTESEPYCEAAREVLRTIPLVMRAVAVRLRQANPEIVPAHYRTLMILSEHNRSLGQLANMQHVSLPTISNTITTLEERGWVSRTRSQTDKRVIQVALTSNGKRVVKSANEHAESYIAALLANLSGEEEKTLCQGLATLHTVFEAEIERESQSRSEVHRPG